MVGLARAAEQATLLLGEPAEDVWLLCSRAGDGTVTVQGSLPPPPDPGRVRALWAGWGPPPAKGSGAAPGNQRRPWLVAHSPGDLRIWIYVPRDPAAPQGPGGRGGSWWFTRPLHGMNPLSVAAAFAAGTGAVYLPYLAGPGPNAAAPELRVLSFRRRWRDEPAGSLPGAVELLEAAVWEDERQGGPRLVLLWRDAGGACHWALWRRVARSGWAREGSGSLGTAACHGEPPQLSPLPGGGARALASWNPRGLGPGVGGADDGGAAPAHPSVAGVAWSDLVRGDFPPAGMPRFMPVRWTGGDGASGGQAEVAASAVAGPVAVVGWWASGGADLVLLLRATGGAGVDGAVEGWLLAADGACRRLGRVAAPIRWLGWARVAVAWEEPVIPCRMPLRTGPHGVPQPWPVPHTWMEALRVHGAGGWPAAPGLAPSLLHPSPDTPLPAGPTAGGPLTAGQPAGLLPAPETSPARRRERPDSLERPSSLGSNDPGGRPAAPTAATQADGPAARPLAGPPPTGPVRPPAPRSPRGTPPAPASPRRPPRWRTVPRPDGS
ncbi:hypothetical protein Tmar_0411 [Thermaerobacter marianensis DSM 12885]|uniref:Uncharacterized protein n=1 Tax=Thermaerobacter marianensis (strain ATCC 700841 / DSM 12885 / JCM 10246 / 7p75a) TaxID=644966 RepID=E6SGI6_THEM7|nr:hypothetical protein [Thermaerobacter marianensis]ADU50532.1 hypothetical protein Tmar_0411 [Thermaerobacter marianensis DSM 12885]